MKVDDDMKNLRLEMILQIVTWIFIIINFTVDLIHGFSKAEIFNYICEVILLLFWSISLVMRKRGR